MKKCLLCGGELTEERETNISEYTCKDCDCMQDGDGTIKSDVAFYLANYGTMTNVEIFQNKKIASKESVDGKVHQAILNHENVYYEEGIGWNYEDDSGLFLETPIEAR